MNALLFFAGGGGVFFLCFLAVAVPLHIEHKPDMAPPPKREVECQGFKESLNTRETRSRWEGKGSKLKVRYR